MDLLAHLPVASLPGPAPMPFLGRAPNVLRFFADPIGRLVELHAGHGDVVALNGGDATWVAVQGAETLRQVLSDSSAFYNLADSPVPVAKGSAPDILLGQALTAINGESHRRARRLMQPVFSKSAVAGYRDEVVATAERIVGRWPQGEADVAQLTLELALQISMTSLFGVDPGDEAAEIGRLSQSFLDGVLSPSVLMFPKDLPGTPYRSWLRDCTRYENILRRLISERRARPTERRDVLSTLIGARDADGTQLEETELVAHAGVLLTASHETSANTLAWTLMLLAAHPAVYAEVMDELTTILKGAAPTVEQLAQLPRLDRVVKESQRLLPAACILFFRAAQAPFELAGHRLPAGARLLTSPFLAHRNAAVFTDPQTFRPARWETLDPSPYEYLPFGAGPRLCIGAQFASQAVRIALAVMLQRHRFELVPGVRIDRKIRGITLGTKSGLPMRLHEPEGTYAEPPVLGGDIHDLVDRLPRA